MERIPIDVIRENIIPYTYNIQSKELCHDIISYSNTKKYLLELYFNRWNHAYYYEKNADINWLENDIFRFLNDDVALLQGLTSNMKKYLRRFYKLRNRRNENNFIENFVPALLSHNKSPTFYINLSLGMLNKEEREYLVNFLNGLSNEEFNPFHW